ncbi:MAG: hypothetical protein CVU03_05295 [Bacteroidetes bacterium HGW-Bacteroidetes-2]|jgi:hypothetical protein|nr:MAG: hypothetical protein CVU03_05295 [Bacteroidetes bacterium HGW-Bacteroidetes-2]
MNKFLILFLSALILTSCKNNEKESTEAVEIKADFIYFDDAAVLKGNDFIYGVKLDAKAKELAEKVKLVKKDEFDMVAVTVKGTINPKQGDQEGWEEIVTINEIISVSDKPSEADVKIQ